MPFILLRHIVINFLGVLVRGGGGVNIITKAFNIMQFEQSYYSHRDHLNWTFVCVRFCFYSGNN